MNLSITKSPYVSFWIILLILSLVSGSTVASEYKFTPKASQTIHTSPQSKKEQRIQKFLNSKLGQWYLKKLEKKLERKQRKLEKRKNRLIAKGNLQKVNKIQKTQDDLATYGIVLIIGGAFCLVLGLVLLVLSLNVGLYVTFLTIGGLGIVVGLVLLLLGILS